MQIRTCPCCPWVSAGAELSQQEQGCHESQNIELEAAQLGHPALGKGAKVAPQVSTSSCSTATSTPKIHTDISRTLQPHPRGHLPAPAQ